MVYLWSSEAPLNSLWESQRRTYHDCPSLSQGSQLGRTQMLIYRTRSFNETYIFDTGDDGACSSTDTAAFCNTLRGGLFDPSQSTTWNSLGAIGKIIPEDNLTIVAGTNGLSGQDNITVNGSLSVGGLSVALPRINGYAVVHVLGLAQSSKVLDLLYTTGLIASRSWSMFWGQTGLTSDNQHDGAVVLGGIDESQITGANYTGRIQQSEYCLSGLVMDVTNLELTFPNGSSGSILDTQAQGQAVNYCILPEATTTTMLREHFENWILLDPNAEWQYSGNSPDRVPNGPNGWGMMYPNERLPQADLKITVGGGGFSVTIPNHQLVQAMWTIDQTTGDIVVNDTNKELFINPLQGEDSYLMPRFAMTLFQAAYLHVNYDDDTFTLWEAANPAGTNSRFVNVESKIPKTTTCSENSTDSSGSGSGSATNSSAGGGSSSKSPSSISGGAIAGIVIGAIVVIASIIAGVIFWRRHQKKKEIARAQAAHGQVSEYGHPGFGYNAGKSELESRTHVQPVVQSWHGSDQTTVAEAPPGVAERSPLSPQEMPVERWK